MLTVVWRYGLGGPCELSNHVFINKAFIRDIQPFMSLNDLSYREFSFSVEYITDPAFRSYVHFQVFSA